MLTKQIKADLFRIYGRLDFYSFVKAYVGHRGFKYLFWWRIAKYLKGKTLLLAFYIIARMAHRSLSNRYGISIPLSCEMGLGIYIGNFTGIIINGNVVLGNNINISHCVTLGQTNRGKLAGAPIIGDGVYLGPGSKVIGGVTIAENSAVGANAVVTKSWPRNAVLAGIPAKMLSDDGAEGYVNRKFKIIED